MPFYSYCKQFTNCLQFSFFLHSKYDFTFYVKMYFILVLNNAWDAIDHVNSLFLHSCTINTKILAWNIQLLTMTFGLLLLNDNCCRSIKGTPSQILFLNFVHVAWSASQSKILRHIDSLAKFCNIYISYFHINESSFLQVVKNENMNPAL